MQKRDSWFIRIVDSKNPDVAGYGEAGPLPGLSLELDENYEQAFANLIESFNKKSFRVEAFDTIRFEKIGEVLGSTMDIQKNPSVLFAFEMALLDLLNGGNRVIFNNKFVEGHPIPINGLIWMGGMDMMLQQIEIKIQEGFNCLKLKVGGLDFEKECDILQYIRRKYFKMDISLRLDANGAFKPEEAGYKLHELSKFNIHSIEQPLKAGAAGLTELCKTSPIPIALDEELIGQTSKEEKRDLLARVKPHFIILKPTLHGGFGGCQQWIAVANELKIGWWLTSALESSLGLNAIAQFAANYESPLHQGLGTGKIYQDNVESPLIVDRGKLALAKEGTWQLPL